MMYAAIRVKISDWDYHNVEHVCPKSVSDVLSGFVHSGLKWIFSEKIIRPKLSIVPETDQNRFSQTLNSLRCQLEFKILKNIVKSIPLDGPRC